MKVSGYSSLRSTGFRKGCLVSHSHLFERTVLKNSERRTSRSCGTVKIFCSGGYPTTTSKVSTVFGADMLGADMLAVERWRVDRVDRVVGCGW